eukprot:CAMPEP_0201972798 /NCGR_PEP_ID=MMETSP0904-20121228/43244_1 /ASSEMBLY_ACC=CAM_ASM_000553 /TAXON_ID=420261 /ORGANISM="Thalassiosira antarctica, Strain CCMP982" /LENGTH=94 /DNA_ID=CAMNT_0048522755 /DNA_START=271 /DNA_END=551 /DNA_ORIENTATION=+
MAEQAAKVDLGRGRASGELVSGGQLIAAEADRASSWGEADLGMLMAAEADRDKLMIVEVGRGKLMVAEADAKTERGQFMAVKAKWGQFIAAEAN